MSPSGPRPTKRQAPPTRKSISHTATECLSSRMPHQRRTCSGFVRASKTRWRGASNTRVITMSVSDGVVTLKVRLFAALLADMGFLLRVPGFHLLQVGVEAFETRLPDVAVALGPVGHLLEWGRLDAARPPLRLAPARDQAGALQHPQVLGDRRHAHVERLGQLGDRALASDQPPKDGP